MTSCVHFAAHVGTSDVLWRPAGGATRRRCPRDTTPDYGHKQVFPWSLQCALPLNTHYELT